MPTDRTFVTQPAPWRRLRLLWRGGENPHASSMSSRPNCRSRQRPPTCAVCERLQMCPEMLAELVLARLSRLEPEISTHSCIRRELYSAMIRTAMLQDGAARQGFLEADYQASSRTRVLHRADVCASYCMPCGRCGGARATSGYLRVRQHGRAAGPRGEPVAATGRRVFGGIGPGRGPNAGSCLSCSLNRSCIGIAAACRHFRTQPTRSGRSRSRALPRGGVGTEASDKRGIKRFVGTGTDGGAAYPDARR